MLEKAQASFASSRSTNQETADSSKYAFVQGSGEDLSKAIPDDGSVDLIIAGTYGLAKSHQSLSAYILVEAQAAHWFDWSKVWPETSRVLRKNGTAAFWVSIIQYFPLSSH